MTGDEQEQAKASGAGDFSGFNPFGNQGFGGQGFSGFESFQDIMDNFEEIFGGGRATKRAYRGEDINVSLTVQFLDAVRGVQAKVNLDRKATCGTCHGSKVKPGTSPTKCVHCGGRGVVFSRGDRCRCRLRALAVRALALSSSIIVLRAEAQVSTFPTSRKS